VAAGCADERAIVTTNRLQERVRKRAGSAWLPGLPTFGNHVGDWLTRHAGIVALTVRIVGLAGSCGLGRTLADVVGNLWLSYTQLPCRGVRTCLGGMQRAIRLVHDSAAIPLRVANSSTGGS